MMITDTDVCCEATRIESMVAQEEDKTVLGSLWDEISPEDKKLSLNNWRYRLLHWCFSVPKGERLSWGQSMYTHYCPLFHLTNMIAIFAPLILMYKIIYQIGKGIGHVFKAAMRVYNRLSFAAAERRIKRQESEASRPLTASQRARKAQEEMKQIPKLLAEAPEECLDDFETFWCRRQHHFSYLKQDDVQAAWTKYAQRIKVAKVNAVKRRKAMQKRMAFWVNFSRIFIKGALNVLYLGLLAGVLYATYQFGAPIVAFMASVASIVWNWFWELDLWATLMTTVKVVGGIVGMFFFTLMSFRYAGPAVSKVANTTFPPVRLVKDVVGACFGYCGKVIQSTRDFISVFYENNCPAITIVDDMEESVVQVEEGVL